MQTESTTPRVIAPQLVMGLLIIAVGVLFTLQNLDLVDARAYLRYWPAGVMAIGALKLWQARGGCGTFAGLLFMLAGTWLLLESLAIVTISLWDVWPLVFVLIGLTMVWRGMRGHHDDRAVVDAHATVSAMAVLGGLNRGNNSPAFRGGDLTAIMGGCQIDLRQATIEGEAVIDVFAMWGGIELFVPENWSVTGRVTPILGGYEDKTRPTRDVATQRLIVRGFAIMGGIEVKN